MTAGLDALLTLSERQLGVMQPRPLATLHVGGAIKSDGGLTTGSITTGAITAGAITASGLQVNGNAAVTGSITASGDIYARWLHTTDGSNGVVQADNGSLYLRSAGGGYQFDSGGMATFTGGVTAAGLTSTGNASVAGQLAAGSLYTAGPLTIGGRFVGSTTHSTSTAGTPGGTGPFEITVSGGGAAMMAFHRAGYYAAHFGLDTDNNFRIGGWSLGNASYKLLDERDYSSAVVGNLAVRRDGNGYIFANYINMTSGDPGNAPVYVAGGNGDGYLRWYPKAL